MNLAHPHGVGWIGRAASLALLAWLWVVMAPTARADAAPQFGIRPANPSADSSTSGYFVLKAQPGQTLHEAVVVENPGTVPVKLQVYPVDATTDQTGGAVYLGQNAPRTDVASWITLDTSVVTLPPDQQTTIAFTIAVPTGTRNGQHLGGMVAQLVSSTSTVAGGSAAQHQSGFGVTTITRAVAAVLLNVGQAGTPSMAINGAAIRSDDGQSTLSLSLLNNGTTLVKPHGDVTMTDPAGTTVLRRQVAIDTFLPGTAISYPVQADVRLQPGTYRVHAELDYGGKAPAVFNGPAVVTNTPASPPGVLVVGGGQHVSAVAPAAGAAGQGGSPATNHLSLLIAVLGGALGILLVMVVALGVYVARVRRLLR